MASTPGSNDLETRLINATTGEELDFGFIYDIDESDVTPDFVQMINRRLASATGQDKLRVMEALDLWIIDLAETGFYNHLISENTLTEVQNVYNQSNEPELRSEFRKHMENWSNMVEDPLLSQVQQALAAMPEAPPPQTEEILPRGPRLTIPFYQVRPPKPIADCLESTYLRAYLLLRATRKLPFFRQQCFHLINQAFHLILRLNDDIDDNDPTFDQADEDELLEEDLEELQDLYDSKLRDLTKETIEEQREECVEKLGEAYSRLYARERSYYESTRDPESDRSWMRMINYDNRTIRRMISNASLGIHGISIHTTERSRGSSISEGHISNVSSASQSRAPSPTLAQASAQVEAGTSAPAHVDQETGAENENQLIRPGAQVDDDEQMDVNITDPATLEAVNAAYSSDDGFEPSAGPSKHSDKGKGKASLSEDRPASVVEKKHCTVPGCKRSFDDDEQLNNHRKEHDEKPYHCQYCGEDFPTYNAHRTHEGIHWLRRRIHYLMRTNQWPPTMPANATYGQQPPGMAAAAKSTAPTAPVAGTPGTSSGAGPSGTSTTDDTAGSKVGAAAPAAVPEGIQGTSTEVDTSTAGGTAESSTQGGQETH